MIARPFTVSLRKGKLVVIKNIFKKLKNRTGKYEEVLFENLTVGTVTLDKTYLDKENIIREFIKNPNKRFGTVGEQGEYFEKFIATVFELAGYKVSLTPLQDKGIDIFVENKKKKYLIQCKNYNVTSQKVKLVGESEVREFNGVTEEGEKILITTSYFTGYVKYEEFKNITFVDRSGIPSLLKEIVPEIYNKYEKECKKNFSGEICETCNKGVLVNKRKTDKIVLLGCSNFPNCKNMIKKVKSNISNEKNFK